MKFKWMAGALACSVALGACQRAPAPDAAPASTATPATPITAAPPSAATTAAPGQVATTQDFPKLALDTIDGKRFDLADHRGKWVVVNFWATWCAPCLKEMPALSALDTMREHIDVIGLAYEDTTPEDMRAFLKKRPVSYPIAMIDVYAPPADFETPVGLPTTWLLDPTGKIIKRFTGPIEPHDIEAAIAAAGGPKPEPAKAPAKAG